MVVKKVRLDLKQNHLAISKQEYIRHKININLVFVLNYIQTTYAQK